MADLFVSVSNRVEAAIDRMTKDLLAPKRLRQWADGTVALLKARCNSRTLRRFILWRMLTGGGVRVEAGHPLATWLEYGTGLRGPARRRIYPKTRKVMRWTQGGKVFYATSTRGMRKKPFFWRAVHERMRKGVME